MKKKYMVGGLCLHSYPQVLLEGALFGESLFYPAFGSPTGLVLPAQQGQSRIQQQSLRQRLRVRGIHLLTRHRLWRYMVV